MNMPEILYTTLRYKLCLACKRPLPEGYEIQYCCSGQECGCYGLPIEPWVCSQACYEILINGYYEYKYMWE